MAAVLAVATMVTAADWPQFRGPARDGKSAEKGLLQAWPDGGPTRAWDSPSIGNGYGSMAVVGGKVYVAGVVGDQTTVTALGADGKVIWQKPVDKAVKIQYDGVRSTPTVDGDRLYYLAESGMLVCFKLEDGKEEWKKNILTEYGSKRPTWALAESPLVDGNLVIVTPGGPKASMVALDKMTGKEVWKAQPIVAKWVDKKTKEAKEGPDGPAYASAVIVNVGGVKQAVGFLGKTVFGVNVATGELLWSRPHETAYDVNATSVLFDGKDLLYAVSGYGTGGQGLKLAVKDGKVAAEQVWTNKDLDDQFGGVVLVDGKIYGTGHNRKGLTCLTLADGKKVYTVPGVGQASVIWADGRLYVQGHGGDVALVDPAEGKTVGQFKIDIKAKMWAHPVVADGKLYIRHDDVVSVYDVKAK